MTFSLSVKRRRRFHSLADDWSIVCLLTSFYTLPGGLHHCGSMVYSPVHLSNLYTSVQHRIRTALLRSYSCFDELHTKLELEFLFQIKFTTKCPNNRKTKLHCKKERPRLWKRILRSFKRRI